MRARRILRERVHSLTNLISALHLALHALGDFAETAFNAANLINDFGQTLADLAHIGHAATHLLAEAIHLHHAARNHGLHLLNILFNIKRGGGGLIGKAANFTSHHQESTATIASFFRFNGCVHAEQIGLVRDLCNGVHNGVNAAGFLKNHGQTFSDIGGRVGKSFHGGAHGLHANSSLGCVLRRFTSGFGNGFHFAQQFTASHGDLAYGRGNLHAA